MKRNKLLLVGGLAFMLVLLPVAGNAAQNGSLAQTARHLGIFRAGELIGELNLTPDQKTQIKSILAQNKAQIIKAARDVVQARLDLVNGVQNAADELGTAQLNAFNLRTSILAQIKPVLTPDQLAKVQQMQQRRTERLQNLLDRLNQKVGG